MASLYFSGTAIGGKNLTLAPMTTRRAQLLDPPPIDVSGYFLFEIGEHADRVLARVEDDEAALSLAGILGIR